MRFLKPHRFVDTMINFFAHESSIIDKGATIGNGTKIWHFCHVFAKAMIGDNCILGQNVMVANNVVLGNNVKVQNNVSIYEGVICEDDVFLGPSMVFTNVINPRSTVNRKQEFKQTVVEKGVTIGANATIICGNNIGKYALIGAGSVVTKTVKSYALIVGNPAVQIGWVSENGQRLIFSKSGKAICSETNEVYELENNQVKKLAIRI
ncbi:MAG: UDP-2-acetamido-3-amino-2,3-dideoxy-glucuronate N-acetyltransferase [Cognaticolwellia sp.]|jgi:UDP-2-acetamido-3-amino-2,3-dideoxy-glucuronate N-acetyltransferase